jgi:hypothetical protein
MKFPIENGVGEVKGNRWEAQQYYNVTLKDNTEKANPRAGCNMRR